MYFWSPSWGCRREATLPRRSPLANGCQVEILQIKSWDYFEKLIFNIFRLCIDYVEENGLMLEGIYRSSGVKSKVNKLRVAFNSRTCSGVNLNDYEPAVVASVLKLVNQFAVKAKFSFWKWAVIILNLPFQYS